MAVKYSLFKNPLAKRPDGYTAQVYRNMSCDKEAIIAHMLERGTLLTRTDILAVLNSFDETVAALLVEGNTVTYPLFSASFSISGVFNGTLDLFDPKRHRLNIVVAKGELLRSLEAQMKAEKVAASEPQPHILMVNCIREAKGEAPAAAGVIEVFGHALKIEGDDPACGLWFVDNSGKGVKAATIIGNKPEKVMAVIPDLKSGYYRVKVVTQYKRNGKPFRIPREFTFEKPLRMESQP